MTRNYNKSIDTKLSLSVCGITVTINKLLLVALLLFTAKNAFALPVKTTAANELAQLLNARTMQANFVQYLITKKGKQIGDKTFGKMQLLRPGKFRWEITKPNKQLIIINNKNHYTYDADLEQLVKRKVNRSDPTSPAMLLSRPATTLKKSFKITKLKTSKQGTWFELIPKTKENNYQWVRLYFTRGRLNKMLLANNLEQTSIIEFKRLVLNAPLATKIFTFTPPPRTDIFETE